MSQGIIAEFLSLHIWPKDRYGKEIGKAMAVLIFLVYAAPLPLAIVNPQAKTQWTAESHNMEYKEYESETGNRLRIASICFLLIGALAFLSVICMILFEDEWVEKIVTKFPKKLSPNFQTIPKLRSMLPMKSHQLLNLKLIRRTKLAKMQNKVDKVLTA